MIRLHGRRYASVTLAKPVGQPSNRAQSISKRGPAPLWIAPSTPPPPVKKVNYDGIVVKEQGGKYPLRTHWQH
jgi:hypothetical protein